jgi:hypothetical protein
MVSNTFDADILQGLATLRPRGQKTLDTIFNNFFISILDKLIYF